MLWLLLFSGCDTTPKISSGDTDVVVIYDQDGDGYDSQEDCDDNNPLIFPDSVEYCNGIDDNCDGEVDENVQSTFYLDEDIDGFGTTDSFVEACEAPEGYATVGTDCDDLDTEIFPGAVEICDGKDNNCDGEIDNGVGIIVYPDADDDGYGETDQPQTSCDIEEGYVDQAGDCDDNNSQVNIGAGEICDELDNNCNGEIDEETGLVLYPDEDSDNFGSQDGEPVLSCTMLEGYSEENTDCNDADSEIYPGAAEICDYIDNDCNGSVDDNALGASTWFEDTDGDGYGGTVSLEACEAPVGYLSQSGDCDNSNNTIYPGAPEECDGIDNDCSGVIDDNPVNGLTWYEDLDSDGFGTDNSTIIACTQPLYHVMQGGDCDGSNNTIYPGASEECDGVDNDCSGVIDDNPIDGITWYADTDGDGFGDPTATMSACEDAFPSGYILDSLDCDDTLVSVYPDAQEECNSIDDDCNGTIDDDPIDGTVYYLDDDGDGYGDPQNGVMFCSPQNGYEINADDCNDERDDLFPENGMCPLGNDCLDILNAGFSVGDGTYDIDIDGSGTGIEPFSVDCDMSTDGGGWTGVEFADTYTYLSGEMTTEDGSTTIASIDPVTGPRTRDGSGRHYCFYNFEIPSGYSQFYLNNWVVRAFAAGGDTSEMRGSITSWSGGLGNHGDVAFGSPDDNGAVASMYEAAGGHIFGCQSCSLGWPSGTEIYTTDAPADRMRMAWGEEGSQLEGWYPWYEGTLYFR